MEYEKTRIEWKEKMMFVVSDCQKQTLSLRDKIGENSAIHVIGVNQETRQLEKEKRKLYLHV